ncbi:MAG: AbrB/MazE/SpoVT family DNA-binding domain-containing protein [Woeseia sp.]
MTRVTGKFQITLPKRLVDIYGIQVGDEVELVAAGDTIAIVPARVAKAAASTEERLHYFDQTTQHQREREQAQSFAPSKSRGWTRDELYRRDRSR